MDGDTTDALGFRSRSRPSEPSPPPPPSYAAEVYGDLEDEHFEYNMKHKDRGIAIIINNETFRPETEMNHRAGSSVDRDNLVASLKFVQFSEIRVKNNLTAQNMVQMMENAAKEDFTDRDCLFVALLSHGDDGRIYGTDRSISFDQIFEPFKKCSTLVGKPKIFLVQACRGEKLDEGVMVTDALPSRKQAPYVISRESDFLIAYSVVPGYYSWRNSTNGSWFVQAFCQVMQTDGRRLELVRLLTRVNKIVSHDFKSNAARADMTNKKQSPCIVSMLTKDLFFSM